MKDLTIVIVTFNSSEIIDKCLKHLNPSKYDVMVVDNASTDNTLEIVSKNFPKVNIIKSSKNIGYGRANNIALRQAKTEFSLVLNPDAFILEEDIEEILHVMKKDKKIALAGPLILDKYPTTKEEIKLKQNKIRKAYQLNQGFESEEFQSKFNTKFLSGAILFLRMKIFGEIGFFNEEFFLFYEDNEICLKSEKNGYKNILISDAFGFHSSGKSTKFHQKVANKYKIGWHLKGWSKFHFKQIETTKPIACIFAFYTIILYALKIIFLFITLNKTRLSLYFGGLIGTFSYLIGLKSFKKDGTARG